MIANPFCICTADMGRPSGKTTIERLQVLIFHFPVLMPCLIFLQRHVLHTEVSSCNLECRATYVLGITVVAVTSRIGRNLFINRSTSHLVADRLRALGNSVPATVFQNFLGAHR
jgi:hypothetical protein